MLNHFQVKRLLAYLGIGLLMWVAVIKSGVHATLAGFLIAIVLPNEVSHPTQRASLEDRLHPWVAYLVLPVFAFVNSGITASRCAQAVPGGGANPA